MDAQRFMPLTRPLAAASLSSSPGPDTLEAPQDITQFGLPLCQEYMIESTLQTTYFSIQLAIYTCTLWYYYRRFSDCIAGWIKAILFYNNICFALLVVNSSLKWFLDVPTK